MPQTPKSTSRADRGSLPDEERRRLAFELHNSTAQALAALAMNLDLVATRAGALDPRARSVLDDSRTIARQCFEEVLSAAGTLSPWTLEEVGMPLALECYL